MGCVGFLGKLSLKDITSIFPPTTIKSESINAPQVDKKPKIKLVKSII